MSRDQVRKKLKHAPLFVITGGPEEGRYGTHSGGRKHKYEFDDISEEMKHWDFVPAALRKLRKKNR